LKVIFLDVGQGDSIFIETPEHFQVLIDGGPDNTVLSRLGAIMPVWDFTIDLVILTHPQADHMNGLKEILNRFNVGAIWVNTVSPQHLPLYHGFLQNAVLEKISVETVAAEKRLILNSGVTFSVLWPEVDSVVSFQKNLNNTSLVVKLEYGSISFLFTGDIEEPVEHMLADGNKKLRSQVLKVPHHGSKTSSSTKFLESIHPAYAIISSGKENNFGHPSPNVIRRFQRYGTHVLRTDELGDITILSDGDRITVFTSEMDRQIW